MKNFFYMFLLAILATSFSYSQDIWINEFSYNSINDQDEFVEIVAPIGTDMSEYGIVFFHNNGTFTANTYKQLSGTISAVNSDNGKGFMIVLTNNSALYIENSLISFGIVTQTIESEMYLTNEEGGILLVNHNTGELVHGVCYELPISDFSPEVVENKLEIEEVSWNHQAFVVGTGKIDAIRLPLIDDEDSQLGGSISMIGNSFSRIWSRTDGMSRDNFSTPGKINTGQGSLPVELASFEASVTASGVKLNWRTITEVNNAGFDIEVKTASGNWEFLDFVNGYGNSNTPKDYTYLDKNVSSGKYSYRLKQIDIEGLFEYSKTVEVLVTKSLDYAINQNYPNPFNPNTTINFTLPQAGFVKLTVYNLLGQEVKTLVNESREAGVHTVDFSATDGALELNSGIYFYKLESGNFVQTRKMTFVK